MVLCGKNKGCHKNIFNVVLGHQSKCSSDNPPLIHCIAVKSNSHSIKRKANIPPMIPPSNYQWYIVAVKSKYPNHHDEITLTTTNFAVSAKVASNQMLQNRCRHFYDHNTATEAEKPYQMGNFKVVHCTTNQRQLLMKNLFWFLRQHFQPAFYLTIMWERHLSTTLKELVDKILTNFKIGRKK